MTTEKRDKDCTKVSFTKMEIKGTGDANVTTYWEFPSLYNMGEYKLGTGALKMIPKSTKTVGVVGMKPNGFTKGEWNIKATNKVILVRYTFSVDGFTATKES